MARNPQMPSARRLFIQALFLLTVFLSAFLRFQVQPLISKTILPWFGGSPAVWITCMLFFQVVLSGGYVYAHLLASRLSAMGSVQSIEILDDDDSRHITAVVRPASAAN
jgi:hypothetical protein